MAMLFGYPSVLQLLAVALFLSASTSAFPNGTGDCPHSRPAVGKPHLSAATVVNGTLADGRIELMLDGDRMSPDKPVFVKTDRRVPIVLLSDLSKAGMAGFFVRLGAKDRTSDPDLTDALSPPSNEPETIIKAKVEETFCREQNAAGITHKDSEPKHLIKGELFFEEPHSDLILDVTVVMKNTENRSEFYYSQYQVQAVEEKVEPTSPPDDGTNLFYFGDSPSAGFIASTVAAIGLTGLFVLGAWI